jgi:hypothetical protein
MVKRSLFPLFCADLQLDLLPARLMSLLWSNMLWRWASDWRKIAVMVSSPPKADRPQIETRLSFPRRSRGPVP